MNMIAIRLGYNRHFKYRIGQRKLVENAASYIVELATRLKPSGRGGFEDFVRQLYQGWTGRRAYLAGSGVQHGGDAGGVGENGIADCISCKRYSERSPSERDVLGEFRQAVLSNPELDLWILAATSPVSRQVARSLHESGQQDGVPVVIIDSDEAPLSRIVCFIAGQSAVAETFLSEHLENFDAEAFRSCIEKLTSAPAFGGIITELKALINAPENGRAAFRDAAQKRLKAHLSDRSASMKRFGQALTPYADNIDWNERPQYETAIKNWYDGTQPAFVLTGEEMMGKSYLAARWLSEIAEEDNAPIPLFVPSRLVERTDDVASLLARACVDAVDTRLSEDWWKRRWARTISGGGERLEAVVVIDGLNERSSIDWPALVRQFHDVAKTGVIKVLFTVRPRFWRDRLDNLNDLNIPTTEVRPYNDGDLAAALKRKNLQISNFPSAMQQILRVPGYFQLGIRLRDRLRNDISIYRLTWEEWRYRRERRNNVSLSDREFWAIVREAAQQYPNQATLNLYDIQSLSNFAAQATQAKEDLLDAGVFEANGDLMPEYKISGRFAAIGLGAYLLSELESGVANNDDPVETLERGLEPQADTDLKSEIIATALFLAVQSTSVAPAIVDTLANNLLHARNRSREATLLLLIAIGHAPERMVALAERHWGRNGSHEAQDVITEAFLRKRDDEDARPVIAAAFNRWMRFVHAHGGTLFISGRSEERAKEKRRIIEERVGYPLIAGDAEFKGEPIVVIDDEMLLRLRSMALHVISGGEIAPFAEAFRGWAAAGAAMHDWDPMDQVQWVLRMAPGDTWGELALAAEALAATEEIDLQRAAYQLADAAGTEEAIAFRDRLPPQLFPVPENAAMWAEYDQRRNDPTYGFYAPNHQELVESLNNPDIDAEKLAERLRKDALDPDLEPPAAFTRRLETVAQKFGEALRWSGRFTTSEQINFERIEPTLAAIAPEALKRVYNAAVMRMADAAMSDGKLDENAVLGLALHIEDCALILDSKTREAVKRIHALTVDALKSPDRDTSARDNLLQIEYAIFGALFPFMSAVEQFEALVRRPPEAYLIRRFEDVMKPLSSDETKNALDALVGYDGDKMASALWFMAASPAYKGKEVAARTLLALYAPASITARGMLLRLFASWRLTGLEDEAKSILRDNGVPDNKDGRLWLRRYAVAYLASLDEPVEGYVDLLSVDEFSRVVSRRKKDLVLRDGLARAIETRLNGLLSPNDTEAPDLPKSISVEIDSEAEAMGETSSVLSLDANHGRNNAMTAANRGGETSVVDAPLFEKHEDYEERVNAILKALSRLEHDNTTSWWRADLSLNALRMIVEETPERAERWVEFLETADEQGNSALWRISGFLSLLTLALLPRASALAFRVQRLARRQDSFGRVNFIAVGTKLPLEMVELFIAKESADVSLERRGIIDKATSDADLAFVAGCATLADAEAWLLEEAGRRIIAESLVDRGKGLMLAALLGVSKHAFNDMIEKSKARRTWLKGPLKDMKYLRRRTHWARCRIGDMQECRGERAYFALRAARPVMHAALHAYIDHTLAGNEEGPSLESSLNRLNRDADKTQKEWEKQFLCRKIDYRIIRV